MANLKDTIVLGNLTVTGSINGAMSSSSLPLAANGVRGGIQIGFTDTENNRAIVLNNEKAYISLPSRIADYKTSAENAPNTSGWYFYNNTSDASAVSAFGPNAQASTWVSAYDGSWAGQLGISYYTNQIAFRKKQSSTTWGNWIELATKSDVKNPADYYWANIKVSASSDTNTRPTFQAAYARTVGVERIQPWNQSGIIEIGDPALSDSSAPGEIRISAFDGIELKTSNINTDSNIDLTIGGHDDGSYRGYINFNGPVHFTQDTRAYFSNNGCLTWRSDGIEMTGDDSYGKIYPKTTNCGYLGKSNQCWYYGYINNVSSNNVYATNLYNKTSANNSGNIGGPSTKWSVIWTQYINAHSIRSLGSSTATSVSAGGYIGNSGQPFGYGYFTNLYKGGSSVSTSDIRLKNNIQQTDLQALSIVNNLHILNYQLNRFTKEQNDLKKRKQKAIATMKELPKTKENRALRKELQELISKPNYQNTLDIGVSAQELEQLLPAKYRNTFILKESTEEFADQRYIKDDNLIYLALKAIQEQQQIINNLQDQVKELVECIHS